MIADLKPVVSKNTNERKVGASRPSCAKTRPF